MSADIAPLIDSTVANASTPASKTKRLVVIGNGMSGARALDEILASCQGKYQITVFGAEPHGSYNRIMLSPVLAGEKQIEQIITHPRPWYQQHGIELCSGLENEVVEIQRARRVVITRNGRETPYDRLVIATGAEASRLPVPGSELPGVLTFRDIADVETMLALSEVPGKRAVVVGGGLLGLEAAYGLRKRGMEVTVVHTSGWLLNRQLDRESGALLGRHFERLGIQVCLNGHTEAVVGNEHGLECLALKDGRRLPADVVIMAVGIRPRTALAKRAGLRVDKGILVSDTLQTWDPSIYAVGECVQHRGSTFGMVAPLFEQARVLASHLAEHGGASYIQRPIPTRLKVSGVDLYSVGDFNTPGAENIIQRDARCGHYRRLVIKDNRLVAAVLYGEISHGPWYAELVENATDIQTLRPSLMFGPQQEAA